ncbi:hypothetical protein ANCDUO_10618 [Ancylostoma duodenale]|uniref:Uncharacterized protein n=1 Tax=Ancylostoma duodenale TaxID=51022 RepID=A0A0C2DA31_9BILA|nr:hypothetical protein ANCDUO_10618 [Ancylostoma duodenale]
MEWLRVLLSVVYYVVCDATVTKFTRYPVTVTSHSREEMVKVTGKCVANAVPTQSEAPTGFCTSSGRWNHLIGECACKPGYTTDSLKGEDKCVGNYQCAIRCNGVVRGR